MDSGVVFVLPSVVSASDQCIVGCINPGADDTQEALWHHQL